MRKITCLAIDDEPLALQQTAAYIGKVPYLELRGLCHSAAEAKKILDEDVVDAIFCDINMPDLNGMDFVKSLASPPLVVFTTAYADYALEGYKVDAVDYLLKPFGLDEFRRAAAKIAKRLGGSSDIANPEGLSQALPEGEGSRYAEEPSAMGHDSRNNNPAFPSFGGGLGEALSLFVKTGGRVVKIMVDDIAYIEGMSEYLKIHLDGTEADGKPRKPIVTLFSMKKMEERLPDYFMRIHRSYIVNLRKIQEVNKNRVIMDADTYLPVGDLYREAFYGFVSRNSLGK